jgi:hypothetical protein
MTQSQSPPEALLPCPFCDGNAILTEKKHYSTVQCGNEHCPMDFCCSKAERAVDTVAVWNRRGHPADAHPQQPSGWRDIAGAPEGNLVVVFWEDKTDPANPERYDFDYLEDGTWMNHYDRYEHVLIAGGHGLKEKAPYTHWMALGTPTTRPAEQQESTLPWHIPVQHWDNAEKAALRNSAAPAEQQEGGDARDAARWRFMRRKLCLTGNGDGTCSMHAINLPAAIPGWPEPGRVAEFCDASIDAAMTGGNGDA